MERLDILWVSISAALVFIMQGGFALLESGVTRSKNSINVAIKNLTDLGVSLVVYWLAGFGLMFGTTFLGWIGLDHFFFHSGGTENTQKAVFFLFQAMFCSTAATIVSGAVAERMRFSAYIVSTVIISLLIYPVVGHWAWGGAFLENNTTWLGGLGFVDFAGSTVVHSVGGWVSLAILLLIGPRLGRYNPDGSINPISGSNIPNAVTGVILLWFGWFGFNGGSTLVLDESVPPILVHTVMGAASGMVAALLVGWPLFQVADVALVINGSVGGLVAITANCHVVNESQSLLIGAVGGVLSALGSRWLDRFRIDDAVSAIPAHLFAGVWGTLAVGLFGDLELLGTGLSRLEQIAVQALGVGATGLWSFGVSLGLLYLVDKVLPLRVSEEDEIKGLNAAEHGATTEIYDLYRTLDEQSRSGDLSLRAPVEPFTEVGQIASMYNKVLDTLEQNVVAKSEYLNILDNMNEGLFLIDHSGVVGGYYSKALEKILRTEKIAGSKLTDLLAPFLTSEQMSSFQDFLEVLFRQDLDSVSVARLNPLGRVDAVLVRENGEVEKLSLSFTFRRLEDQGKIQRVLGIARDLSEQAKLEGDVARARQEKEGEIALFYRILHMDPDLVAEFLRTFRDRIDQMNKVLERGQGSPRDVLKHLERMAHSLKGEASLMGMDLIAEVAHRLESVIGQLKQRSNLGSTDFLGLTIHLSELQQTGEKMSQLLQRLVSFQNAFLEKQEGNQSREESTTKSGKAFLDSLLELAQRLARERGKEVEVDVSRLHLELLGPTRLQPVKDIIIQLLRNAIVHGIEPPEIRRHRSKPIKGRVELSLLALEDHLVLRCYDDGQGLDIDKLKLKASKKVSAAELETWGPSEWTRFAFSGQVSTAEEVDHAAGRGIGMGLVRDLVRKLRGKMVVTYRSASFMEIKIRLPLEE